MKITTFNPQIITKDSASVIQLFEELGFEKRHDKKGIGELNVNGIRMKDENGFYLDVSQIHFDLPRDMVAIRINVDDFDEAFTMLQERGFRNIYGDQVIESKSSESAMLISPSGFAINLIHHIKEHD